MKEDVFSLDEGDVVLRWPDRISKTSARDLQDWLELIRRKIERSANVAAVASDNVEAKQIEILLRDQRAP